MYKLWAPTVFYLENSCVPAKSNDKSNLLFFVNVRHYESYLTVYQHMSWPIILMFSCQKSTVAQYFAVKDHLDVGEVFCVRQRITVT